MSSAVNLALERHCCIDWMAATLPDPCDSVENLKIVASRLTLTGADQWTPTKPLHGYEIAARHSTGLKVMTGRSDMGTHLIAPGSALAELQKGGPDPSTLAAHILGMNGRFSRIDLALDAINSKIDFLKSFRAIDAGLAETKATSYLLVQSNDKGWTLYVGSRTSDRFLRMYNKYAEVKRKAPVPEGCEDWVRFELSASHAWARTFADLASRRELVLFVPAAIREFVFLPTEKHWQSCLSGSATGAGVSRTALRDTRWWLLNSVTKTLAREVVNDPTFLDAFKGVLDVEIERAAREARH